ncbi:MAG: hypothetical protein KC636_05080 [Myxococcales bacterium]|nr:hypothetical protein [Myxococcales bacterium]
MMITIALAAASLCAGCSTEKIEDTAITHGLPVTDFDLDTAFDTDTWTSDTFETWGSTDYDPSSWTSDAGTTAAPTTETTDSEETTNATTTTDTDATTTTDTDDATGGQQAGESCDDDRDCAGDLKCYPNPTLGGVCSECTSDLDCPQGGCTPPNPFEGTGAVCNDGGPGAGCESDAACSDADYPHCGVILEAAGLFSFATCGECSDDGDCPIDAPYCAPSLDNAFMVAGLNECVAAGSLQLHESCAIGSDAACASGVCSVALIMGVVEVGICGECSSDDDCAGTCLDAWIDNDGALIGAQCA